MKWHFLQTKIIKVVPLPEKSFTYFLPLFQGSKNHWTESDWVEGSSKQSAQWRTISRLQPAPAAQPGLVLMSLQGGAIGGRPRWLNSEAVARPEAGRGQDLDGWPRPRGAGLHPRQCGQVWPRQGGGGLHHHLQHHHWATGGWRYAQCSAMRCTLLLCGGNSKKCYFNKELKHFQQSMRAADIYCVQGAASTSPRAASWAPSRRRRWPAWSPPSRPSPTTPPPARCTRSSAAAGRGPRQGGRLTSTTTRPATGAGRGRGRCTRAWGRPPPSTCPPTPAPATWAHTTGRCRTTNTRHALTELHFAFIWIVMTKV